MGKRWKVAPLVAIILTTNCSGSNVTANQPVTTNLPIATIATTSSTSPPETTISAETWNYQVEGGSNIVISSADTEFVDGVPSVVAYLGNPAGCGLLNHTGGYETTGLLEYLLSLQDGCVLVPDLKYSAMDAETLSETTYDLLAGAAPTFFESLTPSDIPTLAGSYCQTKENVGVNQLLIDLYEILSLSDSPIEKDQIELSVNSMLSIWCPTN